jgi:hypothetical protein
LIELNSDRPVRVTAEQRAHPALRRLARAYIAIALLQIADESSAQSTASAPTLPPEQSKEDTATSGQESHHD